MTGKSFTNAYRYVAITLLNTCLVLAAFTGVCWGIFYVHDPKPAPYSSFLHADAMHTMSHDEARRFFLEFDRMGERETYIYQPWLGFSERVYHSPRLNVDEGIFVPIRRTVNPLGSDGKPELVIWMFGGSTMFGWGVPDDQTIASHLAAFLAQRLPDRKIVVVNYGHSYYFSSQEIQLFQILLRRGQRCDAAVFFHGTNDILLNGEEDRPAFADSTALAFAHEQHDFRARFLRISPGFPPVRMMRSALEMLVPPQTQQTPMFDVVNRYRFNLEIASAAGRAAQVPTYFFWQPMPPLNNKQRMENRARIQSSITRPDFHFLGEIFAADDLRSIYIDHFHYGDSASARLAESIANTLVLEKAVNQQKTAPIAKSL